MRRTECPFRASRRPSGRVDRPVASPRRRLSRASATPSGPGSPRARWPRLNAGTVSGNSHSVKPSNPTGRAARRARSRDSALRRSVMWQQRMKGRRSAKDEATEPSVTSVSFEFQVRPTLGCEQTSMIRRIRAGTFVWSPWTSTQISTPLSFAKAPHSRERPPDLLERLLLGDVLRQPVGPHLDAPRPDVLREEDPLAAVLDVLPHDRRVGRVELADRAEARLQEAGVRALLPHACRSRRGQRPLDAVGVGRPELDALEPGLVDEAQEGVEVPVLRDVVGHEARGGSPRPRGRARRERAPPPTPAPSAPRRDA